MLTSRRAFVLTGLASLVSGCASQTIAPKPAGPIEEPQLTQAAIVAAINGVRAQNGKPAWAYNQKLEVAARSQSELMVDKDQMSHNLGVTLRQRVSAAGYEGAVGENLAAGQRTLDQAIDGWLASPGHRATLLSTKFVEFGLAVDVVPPPHRSRYGIYWTLIAGGPFSAWTQG